MAHALHYLMCPNGGVPRLSGGSVQLSGLAHRPALARFRDGQRIAGYDYESGKGDHRHYRNHEEPYTFADVDTLVADFLADVAREQDS